MLRILTQQWADCKNCLWIGIAEHPPGEDGSCHGRLVADVIRVQAGEWAARLQQTLHFIWKSPCVEPIFVVELVKLSWETAVLSLQPWFWKMENVWFIESRKLWMSGFELEPCYQLWEADQGRHSVLVGISHYHWKKFKKKNKMQHFCTHICT